MSVSVEILMEHDVEQIVRDLIFKDYTFTQAIFENFILVRYGITLTEFDKIIKETIPESMI